MHKLCIIIGIAVTSTVYALTFDCRFVNVVWMGIGMNYQCQTKPFNVDSTQYLTNVTGVHMENKNNVDVAAIHISNCTDLNYIPKGLLSIFPNLIGMYLHGCGIASLNGTELNEYPTLKLFALELSPLDHVPGNLFAQNPDVFFVSFNDNKINSTGRDLLSNLNKLSEIYFENNVCIDVHANTVQQVNEAKENLIQQCSLASIMSKSVTLQILLLSGLACFGNYYRINHWS